MESLGQFQGSGPVRVNNLNDLPIYELPYLDGWYGQKVFWAVDAREPGPILVRAVRIDGPGEVGLGDALAPELMLSNDFGGDTVVGTPPPFPVERIFIDGVSFRVPGCYLMQMDGPATTSTVVFRALGDVGNAPCTPHEVGLSVRDWGAAGGTTYAVLQATLAGHVPCRLQTAPAVEIVDAKGSVVVSSGRPGDATAVLTSALDLRLGWSSWCGPKPLAPLRVQMTIASGFVSTALPTGFGASCQGVPTKIFVEPVVP